MPNTPTLDTLVANIAPIAKQLNVPILVVIGQDPTTGEIGFYGSEEAKAAVRATVERKFGFDVPDTAWDSNIG